MEWTRTETLALATQNCAICHGLGLRPSRGKSVAPCHCVLRTIFRACYYRFHECILDQERTNTAALDFNAARQSKTVWGRKKEEFSADFFLVSKRSLTAGEFRIFRYHFLLGADWRLCCRKLKVDKGLFFHVLYRIEEKLGRTFRELEPYGLFPLDEYFGGTARTNASLLSPVISIERGARTTPVHASLSGRIPLRRIA